MYSPLTISNFFIQEYGKSNDITPMKLTKLVYIAHGWYLGFTGEVLIDENPEAWKYGPVIPTIYHAFKHYGSRPIRETLNSYHCEDISESDSKFLRKIWEVYGNHTAIELSMLTHQVGTPWFKVWHRESTRSNSLNPVRQISDNLIKEHYSTKIEGNKVSVS